MAKLTISVHDEAGFDATFETTYPAELEGRLADSLAPLYGYPETVEREVQDPDGRKAIVRVPNTEPKATWLVRYFVHHLLGQISNHRLQQKVREFERDERARPVFVPEVTSKVK